MKALELTGQKFGRLLVETRCINSNDEKRSFWFCRCDCGNEKITSGKNLISGHTRSCGCLRIESARKTGTGNRLGFSTAKYNAMYSSYKNGATKRGLVFNLSKDMFLKYVSSECFYCGKEPINGIDRVDNNKGYVQENIVPCCTTCNKAKLSMSKEDFLGWVGRVHEHHNKT